MILLIDLVIIHWSQLWDSAREPDLSLDFLKTEIAIRLSIIFDYQQLKRLLAAEKILFYFKVIADLCFTIDSSLGNNSRIDLISGRDFFSRLELMFFKFRIFALKNLTVTLKLAVRNFVWYRMLWRNIINLCYIFWIIFE